MTADRWEQGSEFHWLAGTIATEPAPWDGIGRFFGSGRDALRVLLLYGQAKRGWRRLWLPAYFCQEVVAALISTGISVVIYDDGPQDTFSDLSVIPFVSGDVVLRVNYFGLRSKSKLCPSPQGTAEVIDDHTHDPWSDWARQSDADWCIASLRKTLPIPDGGVLWSPRGHLLPEAMPVTPKRENASLRKLAAMVLKTLYLEGRDVEKAIFRQLAMSGEASIAAGAVSGMPEWTAALVATFPVQAWRERRRDNHRLMCHALAKLPWVTVLPASESSGTCPFSAILVFDSAARRERVRHRLIEADVYPAILWPLEEPIVEGIADVYCDLGRRMLSIHCDMRYDAVDIERVAEFIKLSGANGTA